jgi:hypothetical protein
MYINIQEKRWQKGGLINIPNQAIDTYDGYTLSWDFYN